MKLTKILAALSTLALAPFTYAADAADSTDSVIQMPAMIVEATRLPDPLTTMRDTLQSRTPIVAPSHLHVRLPLFAQYAATENRSMTKSISPKSNRRRAGVL